MFIGEYRHTIDDKGRIALPAKFRAKLSDGVIITKGLDSSLVAYTKEEWDSLASKISSLPYTQANARAFSRLMLAGASECDLDKQGRINIPSHLREFAKLKSNVVVVGVFNRIEVWDLSEWNVYRENTEKDSNEIAENLESLGM